MKIVTGHTGENHVDSYDVQAYQQGMLGGSAILDIGSKLRAEKIDDNTVRIHDGVIVMQGVEAITPYGDYDDIPFNSAGYNKYRKDAICISYSIDSTTHIESVSFSALRGDEFDTEEEADANIKSYIRSLNNGTLWSGVTQYGVPLYIVTMHGDTMTDIEALPTQVTPWHYAEGIKQYDESDLDFSISLYGFGEPTYETWYYLNRLDFSQYGRYRYYLDQFTGRIYAIDISGIDYKGIEYIGITLSLLTDTLSEHVNSIGADVIDVKNEVINNARLGAYNMLPTNLRVIKNLNTSGTWSDENVYVKNGVTFTFNTDDNGNIYSVDINGTASAYTFVQMCNCAPVWDDNEERKVHSIDNLGYVVSFYNYRGSSLSSETYGIGDTFSKPENAKYFSVSLNMESGTQFESVTLCPAIVFANDELNINVPYAKNNLELSDAINGIDSMASKLGAKNILPLSLDKLKDINYKYSSEWNNNVYSYRGINFTVYTNSKGDVTQIKVAGTSTIDDLEFNLPEVIFDGGQYILSGIPKFSYGDIIIDCPQFDVQDYGFGAQFEAIGSNNIISPVIKIPTSGTSVNLYVKPMLRLANTSDEYVPYAKSNLELTHEIGELKDSVDEDIADLREEVTEDTTVNTLTESRTYLYRKSKAIGDREYLEYIDGGSLGWNQLVQNGNFVDTSLWQPIRCSTTTSNNVITITKTSSGSIQCYQYLTLVMGHKYFITAKMRSSNSVVSSLRFGQNKITKTLSVNWSDFSSIKQAEGTQIEFNFFAENEDIAVNDSFDVINAMCIDLTLALGPTIADYVYSLEQATAGSGIAWLKEQGLFTDEYYAHDPGSIKNVNVSGHKMVGFNQWDEETESGNIDNDTGADSSTAGFIRSKNYCGCVPNVDYCIKRQASDAVSIFWYDSNKGFIKRDVVDMAQPYRIYTSPNNARFFRIKTYASEYNHDICINISDNTKNGTYEPYEEHIYPITSTDLLGIPVLTSDNKLGFNGDRYNANGRVDSKYDIVDLGTFDWLYANDTFYISDTPFPSNYQSYYCQNICSRYATVYVTTSAEMSDKQCRIYTGRLYVKDSAYSDAATFKTAMSGVYLVYEKETPTTENATPIINPQICSPYGTEEFISDSPVPVPHSTEYYKTPDWIDVEPFKTERKNNDSNTQLLSVINSRIRQDITDRLSNLSTAVSEQNLEKHGYKIGDYFVGASGYNYILADYNTFKGTSAPHFVTANHIGIVVDTNTTSQWYSGDASSVGYNGSTLNTNLKGTVLDNIKSDFIALFGGTTGLEHLLPHSKLFTTALANWGWQTNQYISALSEVQTIGSVVWGANGYQTGEASKKLELFEKYKWTELFGARYPWLRDLYTSIQACILNSGGNADFASVAYSAYVVGLINFY